MLVDECWRVAAASVKRGKGKGGSTTHGHLCDTRTEPHCPDVVSDFTNGSNQQEPRIIYPQSVAKADIGEPENHVTVQEDEVDATACKRARTEAAQEHGKNGAASNQVSSDISCLSLVCTSSQILRTQNDVIVSKSQTLPTEDNGQTPSLRHCENSYQPLITLEKRPISKLKSLALHYSIDIQGCLEKGDIVAALRHGGLDDAVMDVPSVPVERDNKIAPQPDKKFSENVSKSGRGCKAAWKTWTPAFSATPFVPEASEANPQVAQNPSTLQPACQQSSSCASAFFKFHTSQTPHICWDFQVGNCARGSMCNWSHG